MPLTGTIKVPFATGSKGYLFKDKKLLTEKCGANEPWSVKNDYPSGGKMMTLGEGLAKSINTWAAQLVINVGPCDVRETMTKMGLHKGNGEPIDPYISDVTLGSGTTNPMSIASAYATLAASGKYCEPYPITSITTPDKKAIKVPGPQCEQVISSDVADGVTHLLKGTLDFGTAAGNWDNQARPAAGKTGTTEGHNQGWFIGYTKQLVHGGVDRQPEAGEQEGEHVLPERQVLRGLRLHQAGLRWHGLGAGVVQDHARRVEGDAGQGLPGPVLQDPQR